MTDILSYGSVFSGVGGLDLAVEELTGAKAAWHCESDPHASKVLAAHWPDVPNLGDITQVDWASVTRVDIIAGGFPCQDISNAGKRAGIKEGNRSGLWFSYADAIGVLRPRLVVVENVRALLRNGLDVVLGSLSDLGYDARWTCLRASDVGAPHQRERVFLVAWPRGNREGLGWLRGQPALLAEAGPNLLPTPRARDHKGPGFGDDLPAVARLLPTPSASNFNDGEDLQAWQERRAATKERVGNGNGFGTPLSIAVRLDWGEYDPAVRRWAGVVGRPAPRPTCDEAGQRLNPVLSEWMMGWPEGWVTDVVERRHALKQCGNGVVTRQAIAALSSLADPPLVEETPDILSTHQWRGNAQMFAEAVRPLYIRDEDAVLDVTYGLGVFWNDWRPPNLTAHDREPSKAPNGPMDFTALAYTDASFDVVVFDPPYKCVSLDTQALTPTGWASYDEIEVGTEVYTLNHETGLGEWQAVRDVRVVPDPSSPLVEIKGKSHSSLTTSDHRWPVVSLGGRRSWRTTDSFLARDRIPLTARSGCQPALPTIPDAMVELVAWYWTEGHVKGMATGDVTHPGGYGDISQSQVANPTHCNPIEAAFRSLYGPPVDRFPRLGRTGSPIPMWRVDRDHRVTKYRFTALVGRQLAQHAPGKIVTSEFLRSLTESQLDLFIDTSMNADGCRSGSMARLTQKREPMAAMFQVACTLAGIGTTTSHHPHLGHMVYLRRRKAIRPLRQATLREVAPQAVWCLSVPNQSWFARREGTTYFTGNCNGTPTDDGRYGVDERASILGRHGLMLDGFREATRVTKVGGYVMVKCMAQVAGGTLHPQDALLWMESLDMDLKLKARYTLVTNPRPQPKVNPDGSPRPQVSPRNNQSTLLVFQKVRRRRS